MKEEKCFTDNKRVDILWNISRNSEHLFSPQEKDRLSWAVSTVQEKSKLFWVLSDNTVNIPFYVIAIRGY